MLPLAGTPLLPCILQCSGVRLCSGFSTSTSTSTSTDKRSSSCSTSASSNRTVEGSWEGGRHTHRRRGLGSREGAQRKQEALSRPGGAPPCVPRTPMHGALAVGRGSTRSSAAAAAETQAGAEAVSRQQLDDQLSLRPLELDPCGYFLIFVDREASQLVAQHFRNVIDARGLACDPETGEVIPCDGSYRPRPSREFRGVSAKQLSVAIVEQQQEGAPLVSMLSHANYLGRELQKAEAALEQGGEYVQD